VASLRSDKASDDMSFICLDGNALDIGLIGDALIVSTDNIHRSGSTTDIDTREVSILILLRYIVKAHAKR
jgi:hypothetical protein